MLTTSRGVLTFSNNDLLSLGHDDGAKSCQFVTSLGASEPVLCTLNHSPSLPFFHLADVHLGGWALRGAALSTETPLSSFTASKRKNTLKKKKIFSRDAKSNYYINVKQTIWKDPKVHICGYAPFFCCVEFYLKYNRTSYKAHMQKTLHFCI